MKAFVGASLLVWTVLCALPLRAEEKVRITPDVVYGHKDGMALTMDVYTPAENANGAGVLFMVSGGWYSGWAPPEKSLPMFQPLLDAGFTVFAVRHGSSPRYVIPEIVQDVRRSVRFVRKNAEQFKIDADRLGVTGGSAGGHLSLVLGTTADEGDPKAADEVLRHSDRVAAVVAYYPPTDIRPWVDEASQYRKNYPALGITAQQGEEFSPLLHVSQDDAPSLLVHGDADTLVPLDHSERIIAEFEKHKVPAELLVIEKAGHGFPGEQGQRASKALVDWFIRHLGEAAK